MNRLLTGLVSLLALCQVGILNAQSPKLFVMISVEELRSDLLEELSKQMPNDGIKELIESGRLYTEVLHPLLSADATASEAILQTGTTALANGITARQPLIKLSDGRRITATSVLEDKDFTGYATSDRLSPLALSAPTISDQLKQNSAGNSIVYSIAPSAEEAIIAGGQLADGAFWIDSFTGRWASSTYYEGGFPKYIEQLNSNNDGVVSKLKKGITWQAIYASEFEKKYTTILPYGVSKSFSHTFERSNKDIIKYKDSGLVNDDLVEVATRLLNYSLLGKDHVTDLLTIHLTVGAGDYAETDISPEVIDSYYRLDRAIAQLLKIIDKSVGRANTLIALTGNATAIERTPIIKEQRIFRPTRCKALMNMYLNAKYGHQGFIDDITPNGEVFLNHEVIKNIGSVTLEEIQTAVSNFLIDFSGIQYAIEGHRLRSEAIANAANKFWQSALNKALHDNRADVIYELLPGWITEDLSQNEGIQKYKTTGIPTIFVMVYPNIKAEKIQTPIDLREVSKKVSKVLKIRPPTP